MLAHIRRVQASVLRTCKTCCALSASVRLGNTRCAVATRTPNSDLLCRRYVDGMQPHFTSASVELPPECFFRYTQAELDNENFLLQHDSGRRKLNVTSQPIAIVTQGCGARRHPLASCLQGTQKTRAIARYL